MKEQQTPSKLSTRSAENGTGRSKDFPLKKSKKISNKSLNDLSDLFSEESVDFSPFSEITEENLPEDATTLLLEEPASVTPLQPEKTIYTTENSSTNCFDVCEMNKFTVVEEEITLNFLKNFKADAIVTSDNAGLLYKKLRDEIIEYVLQDVNHNVRREDRSHTQLQSQVVSRKKPFLFLCVIIWIIGVLAVLFFTPDVDCGLVPT